MNLFTTTAEAIPCVVLDTNVVLDWLVFDNPACRELATRIESGAWRWVVTPAMADELSAVLAYPALTRWSPDVAQVHRRWSALAQTMEPAPLCALHCRDSDDQKFIDTAVASRAEWLFTRDRDLLVLARKALAWGVAVRPPRPGSGQADAAAAASFLA